MINNLACAAAQARLLMNIYVFKIIYFHKIYIINITVQFK